MKYRSAFEIIGPVMIGPSSSHTAGAVRIGRVARTLFETQTKRAILSLYGSFAKTYKGHGTDFAIIGGILGFAPDDSRVPDAIHIAEAKGMDITFIEIPGESPAGHPNTADVYLEDDSRSIRTLGISIGGGLIEVKEIEVVEK